MTKSLDFADLLNQFMKRKGYSIDRLAELSDVPKSTIVNWLKRKVKKPRSWRDIATIGSALNLNKFEISDLLQSAGHPSITELLRLVREENDKKLLSFWDESINPEISIDKSIGNNLSADMRVAFSALLRIEETDKYVLIRSYNFPEFFGPFGGVYKYFQEAKSIFDALDFCPQVFDAKHDKNDLRGFLPERNLQQFVQWFNSQSPERETFEECLHRELNEELAEIKLTTLKIPEDLSFRHVRTVTEGPEQATGQSYIQYRIFEVYEIIQTSQEVKEFIQQLFEAARDHQDLLVVSSQEIIAGKSRSRQLIGSHACYLLGKQRRRPDTLLLPPK